ncbi:MULTISPECIES: DUF4288 domain-containing protein [unclassified Saccharopolyspora]|uniref:DUF4288 domain-containing protein n=1 Tax=unclassified Saccharopolyspora TaxID=2646250 RepID=UPI001CD25B99|nr:MULTISPECIES: DUF4288 domain-containing protein [unclassified Saccharopolyspora]MCA1190328.1 DUF4288 domain-containing protein [Saccharopolyspora sp. 6T]MCA1195583.1 DUF4288 domain-containing protein [Saccharopolyspora sp. 6V]MCA1228373.1 DUF4288 domain-containing protein [Saccharopolyspora sp. 6M]MCA1282568.1 DUF4288 domain-containing protein [Saccharopolyspora sp. 7B]
MTTPSDDEQVGSIDIGSGSIDPRDFQASTSSAEAEFYVAVLLIEISSASATEPELYEESFVLVKAESDEEAREKAVDCGKQQAASYPNEDGEIVTWKFKELVEVKKVEDATFDDGSELYSRFFRNYTAYRSFEPLLSGEEI